MTRGRRGWQICDERKREEMSGKGERELEREDKNRLVIGLR
jgi:hypothetical protein